MSGDVQRLAADGDARRGEIVEVLASAFEDLDRLIDDLEHALRHQELTDA